MNTLKTLGNISTLLTNTTLAASPIWDKPIDQISRYNLAAFLAKMNMEGKHRESEQAVGTMLQELKRLHADNQLPALDILSYQLRPTPAITNTEYLDGLAQLSRPFADAIEFGIETGWDMELVVTLKWQHLNIGAFSDKAVTLIQHQPRHLRCEYVFWQELNSKPMPLFGMEQHMFAVFGMTWNEVVLARRED